MAYRILLRRDTSTNWSENNPVLASGEPGYETDTGKLKIGDGSTTWNDLPELGLTGATGSVDLTSVSSDIIPSADRTYDIGATGPGNRWRNGYFQALYVDAGTVYIGDVPITSKEGSISVTSINIGPPGVTGSTIYLGDNGTIVVEAEDGQTTQIGATGATGPAGEQGATGPAGEQGATGEPGPAGATGANGTFSATGAIEFPYLPGNQRTGSGNSLQFQKGDGYQKIISTQDGTPTDVTVERLVVSGGDSYFDGTDYIGEGGDIYLWAGKGGNGGDIKVDAGESTDSDGGNVKVRGGYSQVSTGGFVEITAGQSNSGNGGNVEINSGYGTNNGGNISLQAANGGNLGGNITLSTSSGSWTFKNNGDLVFPDNTIQTTAFLGANVNIIETTYSDLLAGVTGSSLIQGAYYLITDFRTCYDQPDYNFYGNGITGPDTYKQAEIDPIIVLATSENALDSVAYQPTYPKDRIKYDVSWNLTEIMGGTAYGRITERIDEYNNRTDYDHRTITFKRYKTRFLNGSVSGRIISMNDGLVGGTGTGFLSDFNVNDVIFIESNSPAFYKVTDIASDTEMTVGGTAYYNFSDAIGFICQRTYVEQEPTPGCLYYFNDTGDNDIDDGGNDMYDGGNFLNTNSYNQIPYTHTQMVGIEGQATLGDFTFDGTVQPGYFGPTGDETNYFGSGSEYFTNTYPGLFVMSAYGVSVDQFSITGNLGADGGGQVEANQFTYNGYTIYTKCVYNAGDPSVNHLIIVNTIDESITHTYDDTSGDDDDVISNIGSATQIHYLLFGLASGIKPTNQQLQNVYQSYLDLIDPLDINVTLSTLHSNYADVTGNLPANSTSYSCLEARQSNVGSDNSDFRNILTFDSSINARNTYIGNACDSWEWDERPFMLPNNVFTNSYGNTVDVWDNYFSERTVNNTFGDDVYENWVGPFFYNNLCYDRFDKNNIKGQFADNIFYTLEFESNTIGENFTGNRMMQNNDAQHNHIGNNFTENRFFSNSSFSQNNIGNNFSYNGIFSSLYRNNIGSSFSNNKLYTNFEDNSVGVGFQDNDIYNDFFENQIGGNFNNNTIGNSVNIGNGEFHNNTVGDDVKSNFIIGNNYSNIYGNNFYSNTLSQNTYGNVFGFECLFNDLGEDFVNNNIGNYFSSNNIGVSFESNRIGNYFGNNTINDYFGYNSIGNYFIINPSIGNNFAYNVIGDNFQSNSIGNDFGFGGGQTRGNRIGNGFTSNTIGEYFYDNSIADLFSGNTVGDYFQLNDVTVPNLSGINFTVNLGVILTFTNNTPNGISGVYYNIAPSGGSGTGATFTVTVYGDVVTNVAMTAPGIEYIVGDVLTINGSIIGGVNVTDDVLITVATISEAPSVYGLYNCVLFKNSSGVNRLSYYDGDDILTIKDINN